MATHSSVHAWRIPGTGEPGRTRLKWLSSSSSRPCHFGIRIILNGRQLRNVKQRRSSLPSPYLPKAGHKFLFVKVTWASQVAQLVKNSLAVQETLVWFLGQEDPLEKGLATHSKILGFSCGSAGKESTCNVGDMGLISGLGRSPGEGKGYLLQYSGLENSMDSMRLQGVGHDWATFTFIPKII